MKSVSQASSGACSPNISNISNATVSVTCTDPAVERTLNAILVRIRPTAKEFGDLLGLINKSLPLQEQLLRQLATANSTASLTADLKKELESVSDALRITRQAATSANQKLQEASQQMHSLERAANAGIMGADPEQRTQAISDALEAIEEHYASSTAATAISTLLSATGPLVEDVAAMAISRDGKRLIAVTLAHVVYAWDVGTGALFSMKKGEGIVDAIFRPPNSDVIVIVTQDSRVSVWSRSAELIATWTLPSIPEHAHRALDVSTDGTLLASATNFFQGSGNDDAPATIAIWNVVSGKQLTSVSNPGFSKPIFSSDGTVLAVATFSSGRVALWRRETSSPLSYGLKPFAVRSYPFSVQPVQGHKLVYESLRDVSPGLGNQILGTIEKNRATNEVWNIIEGVQLQQIELGADDLHQDTYISTSWGFSTVWNISDSGTKVYAMGDEEPQLHVPLIPIAASVDAKGKRAVIAHSGGTDLFNLENRWDTHHVSDKIFYEAHLSSMGDLVFGGTDSGVAALRVPSGAPLWQHKYAINASDLSFPDSGLVALVNKDNAWSNISFQNGWVGRPLEGDKIAEAQISQNGQFYASRTIGKDWTVRHVQTGAVIGQYRSVGWSPRGIRVANDGRAILAIEDLEQQLPTIRILVSEGHVSFVRQVAYPMSAFAVSPDLRIIAVAYQNGTLDLINTMDGTGKTIADLNAPATQLTLSEDGQSIAVGDAEGKVTVFHISTGHQVTVGVAKPINTLTFSPEGRQLAIGTTRGRGARGIVRVVSSSSGETLMEFGVRGTVRGVTFSQDATSLLAGTQAEIVHLPLTKGGLVAALCAFVVPQPTSVTRTSLRRSCDTFLAR